MIEDVQILLEDAQERMDKSLEHLDSELGKIRAGKSSPKMLESVRVDNYGMSSPITQVASINTPDPRTLVITPWDKKMIPLIEKAIMAANIGLNPDNNGDIIRLNVPPLTEERRRDLVKQAKKEAEDAKISVRAARRDVIEDLKKMKKEGLSEDMGKDAEEKVQNMTDKSIRKIDELMEKKEKDILTI